MSTGLPFKFGQNVASDYVPFDSSTSSVWIRGFRDGSTQIRIAPAEKTKENGTTVYGTEAWPFEFEHYDQGMKRSWVCPRKYDSSLQCWGCNSTNEGTRRRTRTYYINALDDKGEMRIYKMGVKLFGMLEGREKRLKLADPDNVQPLSDRDLVVIRSGKDFNEIAYDVDYGERYKIEWDKYELNDIAQALEDAYVEVAALFGDDSVALNEVDGEPVADEAVAETTTPKRIPSRPGPVVSDAPDDKPAPAKRAVAKKTAAKKAAPAPVEETDEDEEEFRIPENGKATVADLNNADTPELRDWLTRSGIEFPANAPRARLLKIAEAEMIPF